MRGLGLVLLVLAGCAKDAASTLHAADPSADLATRLTSLDFAPPPTVDMATTPVQSADLAGLVAGRPYTLKVPNGYDAQKSTPLVINLHGYGGSGAQQEMYFNLGPLADAKTFLYATPDGTADVSGMRFWNATDGCCNIYGSMVDDVGYIRAIIEDVRTRYNLDGKRVYIIGHSNGGFMSHRLACELSDQIAGIVSLAGAEWKDPAKCPATQKVAVLQVHGDTDERISYSGGTVFIPNSPGFPSAHETVATWAAKNGCSGALAATGVTLDLEATLAGNETTVEAYSGCPTGNGVELWTVKNGKHTPTLQPAWGETIYGFLSAHPKP